MTSKRHRHPNNSSGLFFRSFFPQTFSKHSENDILSQHKESKKRKTSELKAFPTDCFHLDCNIQLYPNLSSLKLTHANVIFRALYTILKCELVQLFQYSERQRASTACVTWVRMALLGKEPQVVCIVWNITFDSLDDEQICISCSLEDFFKMPLRDTILMYDTHNI